MQFDKLVAAYVKLRDLKAQLEAEAKAKVKPVTEKMDQLEGILLAALQETGQNSANTPAGTAYMTTDNKVSVADWPAFLEFVQQTGEWDLIKRAASKEAVMLFKQAAEAEGAEVTLPPGINWSSEMKLGVQVSAKQRSAA